MENAKRSGENYSGRGLIFMNEMNEFSCREQIRKLGDEKERTFLLYYRRDVIMFEKYVVLMSFFILHILK